MQVWRKEIRENGRIRYYLFGIKIFSFRPELNMKKVWNCQQRFRTVERRIREKVRKGKTVNVVFLVGIPSMFSARPLMEKMVKDSRFEVAVAVIPDLRFGKERAQNIQEQALQALDGVPNVFVVPIEENDDRFNLLKSADIVFPATPYDISHVKYNLLNMAASGCLPAMVNYGFFRSVYDRWLISNLRYGLYWKVFAETQYNVDEYNEYSVLSGSNVELTGYCKMDGYSENDSRNTVKTIMIAPHHSLEGGFNNMLSLSNFDKYADLYLELPDRYPQVNFIFRPHPALFIFLSRDDQWGQEKVSEYIFAMKSLKNVVYSEGGDYFKDFADSDALIDDCGSYLVEYFYTGKPQCYLLKDPSDIDTKFAELGRKCLDHCYIAYSENEIIKFIEDVVVRDNDFKKQARVAFAKNEVMLNYPCASDSIISYLMKKFA